MNSTNHNRLQEYKTRAAILLKKFQGNDNEAENAATRFLQLPFLKHSNTTNLLNDRSFFRLKHAQQVLAIENGFNTWDAFRHNIIVEDCLFHNHSSSFLNIWFNNYDEAKAYQTQHKGYLLQFRKDYAVCTQAYIDAIGLSSFSSEWAAMEYDWVKPASKKSWQVVFTHLKKQYLSAKPQQSQPGKKRSGNRPEWLKEYVKK